MVPAGVFLLALTTGSTIIRPGLQPPTFRERPVWPVSTYYDEDGPSIKLDCKVSNVSHKLIWLKNGDVVDVVKEQLLLQDMNQSLIFEVPKQFQSGSYKCLAYNAAGNISHTGNILIIERKQETRPRVIETQPVNTDQYAEVGETVNISCTFDVGGSVAALMYLGLAWFKGNETVNDTNHTTYGLNYTSKNNIISSLNIDRLKISDYGTYQCYGNNSKGNTSRFITVMPPKNQPKVFPLTLVVGCSAAGVVAMVTVVAIVAILKHRQKLKQGQEDLEWLDPDANLYDVPDRQIEYDVFISYSSEDLEWVKDVLFYKLCNHGYSVCIDFKDFTPGVAVAENIIDAIYKSYKTIVLMSKNFLKSMWGQFELQQAHNRAIMQRSEVLILIKYDNSKVPTKLMGKTFLDWSDAKVQPHFWTRLFEAIGKPAVLDGTGERDWRLENKEQTDEATKRDEIIADDKGILDAVGMENKANTKETEFQQDFNGGLCRQDIGELGVSNKVDVRTSDCDPFDKIVDNYESQYEEFITDTGKIINIRI